MKRIVIISPRLENSFSGAENYIVSLAKHLSKNNEVHIVTKTNNGIYPNLDNIKMHYIEGIGSGNVNILKAIPNLKNKLDEINPDIVHLHCFISLFLYSSIIEANKYNVIVTVHSTPHGNGKLFSWFDGNEAQRSFIKIMYEKLKCDVTLFGSSYYMDEYTKAVPIMKKVSRCYVNPYYSDIKEITIDERKEYDKHLNKDNIVRLLFPSRVVKRKGIEETLELLKLLPNNYILELPAMAQIEYQNYNEVVLELIDKMNLKDRVIYPTEKVIGTEMFEYYKRADVTLIPSYFEGFGIVAVEAMNASSPVITTCKGGLSEIIQDNYNGVKMSIDNLFEARDKIIKLVEDKKYRYKIIKNAKKTVEEKYTKEKHMKLIDEIYDSLG